MKIARKGIMEGKPNGMALPERARCHYRRGSYKGLILLRYLMVKMALKGLSGKGLFARKLPKGYYRIKSSADLLATSPRQGIGNISV